MTRMLFFPAILLLIISLAARSESNDKNKTEQALESYASVSMPQVSDIRNLKYPKTRTPRLKKYSYISSFEVIRETE